MKPILFNTEMVRAILAGRKTETRRIVKDLPDDQSGCDLGIIKNVNGTLTGYGFVNIPYQPGDILYVRETWYKARDRIYYKADNLCTGCTEDGICLPKGVRRHITCKLCEDQSGVIKWHPSIHMPKEAARIFLRVINVGVERLQDITDSDCFDEGAVGDPYHYQCPEFYENYPGESYNRSCFLGLWNSTIKKQDIGKYGWNANPWVWVIEFERCEKPEVEE